MRKILFTLFFVSLFSTIANAQDWSWVKGATGNGVSTSDDVLYGNDGFVYVCGRFSPGCANPIFDTIANFSPNDTGGTYIAKYTHDGQFQWLNFIKGYVYPKSLEQDNDGNFYIGGTYKYTPVNPIEVVIGSNTLPHPMDQYDANGFIGKFDPNGNWIWSRTYECDFSGGITEINFDRVTGDLLVGGLFAGYMVIGSDTLNSQGNNDPFLFKINKNGNALWAKSGGGWAGDFFGGIAVDLAGNSYMTGSFITQIVFNSTVLDTLPSSGFKNLFVVKYDIAGNVIWAKAMKGEESNDIICDTLSNTLYLTGSVGPEAIFDTIVNNNIPGSGLECAFVVKMDLNGQFSNLYLPDNNGRTVGIKLAIDQLNRLYVTGRFGLLNQYMVIGNDTLTSNGTRSLFVTCFDNTLTPQWAKKAGGTYWDYPNGISATPAGDEVFVCGDFESQTFVADTLIWNGVQTVSDGFWGRISIPQVTGIETSYIENKVVVYPNPFSDQATLMMPAPGNYNIELYDISGKQIRTYSTSNESILLSREGLPSGIYFCRLVETTSAKTFHIKLIVNH
jgi:hypothetical protein